MNNNSEWFAQADLHSPCSYRALQSVSVTLGYHLFSRPTSIEIQGSMCMCVYFLQDRRQKIVSS